MAPGLDYPGYITGRMTSGPAFLFDLDGTLVDSVYQHVLAWREAPAGAGIELSVWRIHRRIRMRGGVVLHAPLRVSGRPGAPRGPTAHLRTHTAPVSRHVSPARPPPPA